LAVLDVMQAEDVPARAEAAGRRLRDALESLPEVTAVRGAGLLLAAELAPGLESGPIATACLQAGLVCNEVTPTALRFAPSLLVSDDEIDEAVEILHGVLAASTDDQTDQESDP